ncbi:MAG: toll/interleukin-1 receptor domain-containing protein, partial [Eubacteriales bacterium]|nr:toll/interleukin-1 receptor domain-containing protein [Eubacteriales bacterium]
MESKKVFISYSWSVQERVIELAERLLANGIEVVLDVYDLKEGQDKYAFMEQSVNDPSIDRVLIICDKVYTEKANSRSGGVGDETVIISPEIYNQVKQEKFIPIIFEVDDEGKAYCPAYIKSRIYIDLSTEDDGYEIEYEKLLRNIFEKPMYKKPALG